MDCTQNEPGFVVLARYLYYHKACIGCISFSNSSTPLQRLVGEMHRIYNIWAIKPKVAMAAALYPH